MSGTIHFTLSYFFPPVDLFKVDDYDAYGTFTASERQKMGVAAMPSETLSEKAEDTMEMDIEASEVDKVDAVVSVVDA
jgi:hypothetical protein